MTSFAALRSRSCPMCGSTEEQPEISSKVRAEFRPMDELRPFWFGIEKERRFFTYHRCPECDLLYNPVFFGEAQLIDLYSAMPPNMDSVASDAIAATQRGYFEEVAGRCALDGDYLEIGPDVGYIAGEAARRGAFERFWLFEPNRQVHAALRAAVTGKDARVIAGMSDLSAVPDSSVGLAVMVHVLDHLLDPVGMLAEIRRTLRPGGTLMIVTHDEKSMLRRVLGRRWPAFCLQHPELYNPDTIRRLMGRAGFGDVTTMPSRNYFPIDFLGRQAASAFGLRGIPLPLPSRTIGLRLGNMLTLARQPDQAARAPAATRLEIEA